MISNEAIADNLYSLYGDLADEGLVSSGEAGGFDYVRHAGFAWPNMAYRGNRNRGPASRDEIRAVKTSVSAGACPRLIILEERAVTAQTAEILAEERLIAATEWVTMALPVGSRGGREGKDLLKARVIDVENAEQWSSWSSVVSGVLFRNEPLDPELFRQAAREKRFTLLTGYAGEEPVATCLIYFTDHAGIYMVATLPAFQGKGWGGRLMERAAAIAAAKGYETIVLQSTKAGLDFYRRLGFQPAGKLLLYYCMP